jgi:hypothetical protein
MTETLAAFPWPYEAGRAIWTWCRQRIGGLEWGAFARLEPTPQAEPDRLWLELQLRNPYPTSPSWPSVSVDGIVYTEAGRRLLADDPAAVVAELLRAHRTDTPHIWHYMAATAALQREGREATPAARNELAEALRAECCRLRIPDPASLDDLNRIATEAIEGFFGDSDAASIRSKLECSKLYWWAERRDDAPGYELRFMRSLAVGIMRRNRHFRPAVPMQIASFMIRSTVEQPELASDGRIQLRADDGTTRTAAAQVRLMEASLGDLAPPGVVPLTAYLATVCYEQHRRGLPEADARRVVIPSVNREHLRRLGIDDEKGLHAALEWLRTLSLGQAGFDHWACVTGYGKGKQAPSTGGRPPAPGYVVEVGYPLAPFASARLRDTYARHGMTPPPSLGFFAPVLPVELAPPAATKSYAPTHKRQLDAYCVGLPYVLMDRREEYANRGILIDDLKQPLHRLGIYSRKGGASLFDSLTEAWVAPPESAQIGMFVGRSGAVLVPVEDGSGRYRLGPDYEDAHEMIRDAAGLTEHKSDAGKKGLAKARKRRGFRE